MKTVAIISKSARMGKAKTRLAKDIGHIHAMRWSRMCLQRALHASAPWTVHLRITPDRDAKTTSSNDRYHILPQGDGNLGTRLHRALNHCPHGPVVIIGSDAPAISQQHIASAFKALRNGRRAVFGPSADGGFWLIGLSASLRRHKLAFNPVRWSTRHALSDMRELLPPGTGVLYLPTLVDLDDAESLHLYLASQNRPYRR